MIGLEMGTVRIVPHDPAWSKAFEAERKALQGVLGPLPSDPTIEHVGSTAVQGLAAKPIVDIAIGFHSLGDVRRGLTLLVRSGRRYVKGANQPGMLFMASGEEPGRRTFHYHLVLQGTPAWRKLLVFRDYLRRHPGAAKEYGDLKARLAERYPRSRQDYMAHKRPVLRALMQRGFAEEGRRRHAAALHTTLSLAEEPGALRAWWGAERGRPPWQDGPVARRIGDRARPDEGAVETPDLEDFEPGADA